LVLDADLIDLHIDTEDACLMFGYDPAKRHRGLKNGTPFFGQVDFPRLLEGSYTGVVWDLTANPLIGAGRRRERMLGNLAAAAERIEAYPERLRLVRTAADYRRARAEGKLAFWLSVQGGNAFACGLEDLDRIPRDLVCRVTLVHLTNSQLGGTSSPLRLRARGLSGYGRQFVEALQERRILVDLAHIHPRGFWDALETADPRWPVIVSHTGVNGVRPYWRNLDDRQIRAVADRGGVVGIIYHRQFLEPGFWWRCRVDRVADHLEHIVRVGGEDVAALGSDYDGSIVPPRGLADPTEQPRLVQKLLDRGFSEGRIRKILGTNWLRVLEAVRPG